MQELGSLDSADKPQPYLQLYPHLRSSRILSQLPWKQGFLVVAEMYDQWYLKQESQFNDSHSSDWEIFGLKFETNGTRLRDVERVATEEVLTWITDQVSSSSFCSFMGANKLPDIKSARRHFANGRYWADKYAVAISSQGSENSNWRIYLLSALQIQTLPRPWTMRNKTLVHVLSKDYFSPNITKNDASTILSLSASQCWRLGRICQIHYLRRERENLFHWYFLSPY